MNHDEGQRPLHTPPSRDEYDRYLDWLREQEETGLRRLGRMPCQLTIPEAADFLRVSEQDIWDAIRGGDVAAVKPDGVVRVDTATLFDELGIARSAEPRTQPQEQSGIQP